MPAGLDGHPDPIRSPDRTVLLTSLADRIEARADHPRVLIGVDGASGTGKSTLADEVAGILADRGRHVVRASIDSFHRPRAERYRRGDASPEGYYRDSHDLPAVRRALLEPFAGGAPSIRCEAFDEPADRPIDAAPVPVPDSATLVFDGLFLHRPELVGFWHLTIFLTAEQRREAAWMEYLHRDLPDEPERREAEVARRITRARRGRYTEGQALYEAEANPRQRATVVIDNDDLSHPKIIRS